MGGDELRHDLVDASDARRLSYARMVVTRFYRVQFFASVPVGIAFGIWAGVHGMSAGTIERALSEPSALFFSSRIFIEALTLVAVIMAACAFGPARVGITTRNLDRAIVWSLPLLAFVWWSFVHSAGLNLGDIVAAPLFGWALAFSLLVAMVEEITFRGILVGILGGRSAPDLAIVGSATIFGTLHVLNATGTFSMPGVVNALMIGLAFGVPAAVVFLRTGTVLSLIVVHTVWDTVVFSSWGVQRLGTLHSPEHVLVLPTLLATAYLAAYVLTRERARGPLLENFEPVDVEGATHPWLERELAAG